MNRLRRIGIGALLGAVLTLAIHPISRRYVLTPFLEIGHSEAMSKTIWLPRNLNVLPVPRDTLIASVWMQTGAEMLVAGREIPPGDLERLIEVAEASAKGDPDNGFWPQIDAVFLWKAGKKDRAMQQWFRASHATQWNDYQSHRLQRVKQDLQAVDGGPMSWHAAAAYFQRSTATPRSIEWMLRAFFKLKLSEPDAVQLRLATLRNGRLIREGARSVVVGDYGASMIELAAMPFSVQPKGTPKEQLLARYAFVASIRPFGERIVEEVDDAFRTNDAWFALAVPTQAQESARNHSAAAILLACTPGILLGIALIGLALRGIVFLFEEMPKSQALLQPPIAPILGIFAGIALYMQTGLALAAIAVAMCFGFLAYEPARVRKHRPERLGTGFSVAVLILSVLFAILIGGFWLGISAPSQEILPHLKFPIEAFGGNTLLLSLAALVLSLLLLAAPGWAIVERVPTPFATVVTLREFSRKLFWGAIIASVIATPMAVYLDNQVQESMTVLLTNEPARYLLQ